MCRDSFKHILHTRRIDSFKLCICAMTHSNCATCSGFYVCVPFSSVAVGCSVWQCVAVCCSVLQCVAVCCSVLQCVAVCPSVPNVVSSISMRVALCVPLHFKYRSLLQKSPRLCYVTSLFLDPTNQLKSLAS